MSTQTAPSLPTAYFSTHFIGEKVGQTQVNGGLFSFPGGTWEAHFLARSVALSEGPILEAAGAEVDSGESPPGRTPRSELARTRVSPKSGEAQGQRKERIKAVVGR